MPTRPPTTLPQAVTLCRAKLGAHVNTALTLAAQPVERRGRSGGIYTAAEWTAIPTPPRIAPPRRPACGRGRHAWRVIGRNRDLRDDLGCERPLDFACRRCERTVTGPCGARNPTKCEPCATKHRERVRLVASLVVVPDGDALMLTLTAPGHHAHRYRHNPADDNQPVPVPAGQPCPCTPGSGVKLAEWNARNSERWNRFVQDLRRTLGVRVEYMRTVERQSRGALHDHVLLRRPGGKLVLSPATRLRVGALVLKHGYGHSWNLRVLPGAHAARYLAKYVTKATIDRRTVPWHRPDRNVFHRSHATYRTWTASRRWGCTLKWVRQAQGHHNDVTKLLVGWRERSPTAAVAENAPYRPDLIDTKTGEVRAGPAG